MASEKLTTYEKLMTLVEYSEAHGPFVYDKNRMHIAAPMGKLAWGERDKICYNPYYLKGLYGEEEIEGIVAYVYYGHKSFDIGLHHGDVIDYQYRTYRGANQSAG